MIYVMHIREVIPEKLNEYNEFQVKEYQPFLKKINRKVVAYFGAKRPLSRSKVGTVSDESGQRLGQSGQWVNCQ
jgi:hypothetical protein